MAVSGEAEAQIVGFAAGGPVRQAVPGHTGELHAIDLLPEVQRRGTGRRLLGRVAADLARSGHVHPCVWMLADNPSRAFYERLGGREVARAYVSIGGAELPELAYGYDDLGALVRLAAGDPA